MHAYIHAYTRTYIHAYIHTYVHNLLYTYIHIAYAIHSTLANHVQLQTDLYNLAIWCDTWQLNFYATKCKVMVKPLTVMKTVTLMRYYWTQLIVTKTWASYLIAIGLKFHQHASEAAMKASRVLAFMRRGFYY